MIFTEFAYATDLIREAMDCFEQSGIYHKDFAQQIDQVKRLLIGAGSADFHLGEVITAAQGLNDSAPSGSASTSTQRIRSAFRDSVGSSLD